MFRLIIIIFYFLVNFSSAMAHEGGGIEAAARAGRFIVEECVAKSEVSYDVDVNELDQKYGPENSKYLYILGLAIFKTQVIFNYTYKGHAYSVPYDCDTEFPYWAWTHFPQFSDLEKFVYSQLNK